MQSISVSRFRFCAAIGFATALGGVAAGCMDLDSAVIVPVSLLRSDLPPEPPANGGTGKVPGAAANAAAAAENAAAASVASYRLPVVKTRSAPPNAASSVEAVNRPIPNTYAGLAFLNLEAKNPPQPGLTDSEIPTIAGLRRPLIAKVVNGDHPIITRGTVSFEYVDRNGPLDPTVAQEPGVRTFLAASQAVLFQQPLKGSINRFNAADVAKQLAKSASSIHNDKTRQSRLLETLSSIRDRAQAVRGGHATPSATVKVSLDAITIAYLEAYLQGKYRDRKGTLVSQPDISKKLGSDTVTAFESVLLDAIFDYATMTPVLYDPSKTGGPATQPGAATRNADAGGGGNTKQQDALPTFVVLFPDLHQPLVTDPHDGITADEQSLMEFLSGIGGEQTKHLSNALIRLFGGASAVAKLSVGDNDTVSKVVSTFCQEFIERTSDALSYDFFARFHYTVIDGEYSLKDPDDYDFNEKNLRISRSVSDAVLVAIKNQQLLTQLLGPKAKTPQPAQ